MVPWLAMGHIIPYFQFSKCLAQKGLRVSFVSTPRNLQRLPSNLSSLINLVSIPFVEDYVGDHLLPDNAECTTDIPIEKIQYLKDAFDGLEPSLTTFLEYSKPDWTCHWLPGAAAKLGVPSVFFGLFPAASFAFLGPPAVLLNLEKQYMTIEDFTTVPKWVPFHSNVVYRLHELLQFAKTAAAAPQNGDPGISDMYRFGTAIRDSKFVALRSCVEFESEWLNLLTELYEKPVIPVGLLPPSVEDHSDEEDHDGDKWVVIKEWLDKHREGSVVYAALGNEAALSQEQVNQLALGLESSELPFFWVLRKPPCLPEGFKERTRERGMVYMSWAPQVRILAHQSVGGFLTHCGLNSDVEGLAFDRALILLPMINDQALNARLLEGKKVGLEIPRNKRDGSFTSESVAESLRTVMVDKEGEIMRNKGRDVFGDAKRHVLYSVYCVPHSFHSVFSAIIVLH